MLLQQEYVETKLETKFARFNIRVYPDDSGKETLVLSTENLDLESPVLTRVHSECITGDMLGSLHCDCGQQLTKSLQLIGEEGGVLIYLRQEGRGIGLFEKIKTYQLQSQGYDTFEANVLLGHQPDPRSYEMVKTVLDDLHISSIKLLTNNPSKVTDITKLGIEVAERIPLISKSNKYNKAYLETKMKKFHHFLGKEPRYYFYQFQIDDPNKLHAIMDFINHKKMDPLLRIYIGITANHSSIKQKSEIDRIQSIIQLCNNNPNFIPVIHFSFSSSKDVLEDVYEIKKNWPMLKHLQVNDLAPFETSLLKEISKFFLINIPLCDENFEVVEDKQFREFVANTKSFIMLDNSKGKGVKESKKSLKKKINLLLGYGLNDIVLCGGFGPDQLESYFEIRRYYKINLSIDAETNLKTNGKIDVNKVKLYLQQLIRFDEPKWQGVEQTRKFLELHRRSDWDKIKINEREFLIHPKVFHAGFFPSSTWFASQLCDLTKNDSDFCEVGCGSGVISCLVGQSNPKIRVTATDINPHATENTKLNAENLGLSKKISVFTGDVLDNIDKEARFDSIFWALPFGFLDPGAQINLEEAQVFDPGYRAIRKFFQTAKDHLKPKGRLLLGFSSDLGHPDLLAEIANEYSFKLVKLKEKAMKEDNEIVFEILEGRIT